MTADPHIPIIPIDPKSLKKLRGQPVATFLSGYEPNERRTFWVIFHCKEAFNPRFTMQFVSKSLEWREQNGNFMKYSRIVSDLKVQGYIKQDKKYNWHITPKGYLHWLTLNSKTVFWLTALGIITMLGIVKFSCGTGTKNNKEPEARQQIK
ncbi:MAG: hypothetical protein ABI675_01625 [Chitinophagaceae bacterium]